MGRRPPRPKGPAFSLKDSSLKTVRDDKTPLELFLSGTRALALEWHIVRALPIP